MTRILGLSGKKQSGKTTTMNLLGALALNEIGYSARLDEKGKLVVITDINNELETGYLDLESFDPKVQQFFNDTIWPMFKVYSFATPLKWFCITVLGLTHEQCYGTDEEKNSLTSLKWENMPDIMKYKDLQRGESGYYPQKTGQMTAREVLQYFGTKICRKMYNDCWVDAVIRRIKQEKSDLAVIPDVRFPNEVNAIRKAGGKVIRFTRAPFAETDKDESEIALDNWEEWDTVIDNKEMSIPEQCDAIRDILTKFEFLKIEEE